MKSHEIPKTKCEEPQSRAYARPKATYVPIKLEERLLACEKTGNATSCSIAVSSQS